MRAANRWISRGRIAERHLARSCGGVLPPGAQLRNPLTEGAFRPCRAVRSLQQGTYDMKNHIRMLAIGGLVFASAAPVLAQTAIVDPMTMTCADYGAMDSAGMMKATEAMDMMMGMTEEEKTAAMAMTAEEKAAKMAEMDSAMAAMTEDEKTAAMAKTTESMTKMTEACKAKPDGTVMDAAKAAM
jgi:hypothetical protein